MTRCQTIRRPDRTETTSDRRGVRAAGRARCWTTTACLVVLVALASVLCGCIERMLLVSSEPAGAILWLNDQEVGRTPLQVPFTFYGTYDVRLEAEGFQTLWTKRKAKAPWFETVPLDLIAEAVPDVRSHVAWHFHMELQRAEDEHALNDRALQTRAMLNGKPARHDAAPSPKAP